MMRKSFKKKGLSMSNDMELHPEKYNTRVVVAFDAKDRVKPYLYVLPGSYTKKNSHQIRSIYTKTTGANYFDTRVILYDTYVKRVMSSRKLAQFGNELPEII